MRNFRYLILLVDFLLKGQLFIALVVLLACNPVKADDNEKDAKFDWMSSSLSGLAALFSACLEVPKFNSFQEGSISLDLTKPNEWNSTGNYVKKDKAIKFDWSTSGAVSSPRRYRVMYRIDPRFNRPQIFIKTFNYLTKKYEATNFPKFKATDPTKDYISLAFSKMQNYVDYFNFAENRQKIRVEKGDVINITLTGAGDFFSVATDEDFLKSELDNNILGVPSLYTNSNLDNKILYSTAGGLPCRYIGIGLCISGEGAGAAIFILEHHQNLRPGFTAGLVHGSNMAGTLIATLVGIIIEQYFYHFDFAWRFAFLLGGAMGLVGFYLRLRVSETPIFKMLAEQKKTLKAPFINVVKTAWKAMFLTFCTGAVASSVVYLVKTYIIVYYHDVMHLDNTIALTYMLYANFISMVSMPLFGGLTDIIGKFKTLALVSLAILILALPILLSMSLLFMWQQILALTILGILSGAIAGAAYSFIISLFTPEQKFSGVSFSYNLGIAIFGGTSPLISRWLVEKTGLFYAPAFYIMTTSSIFLVIIYFMRNEIRCLLSRNSFKTRKR